MTNKNHNTQYVQCYYTKLGKNVLNREYQFDKK